MPIGITPTKIVDGATAAASTASVTRPESFHVHRFFITFTAAATVQIQASTDGVTFIDLLTTAVTTTDAIKEVDRPWRHLRVDWTGNTGTLNITVEQIYSDSGGTV